MSALEKEIASLELSRKAERNNQQIIEINKRLDILYKLYEEAYNRPYKKEDETQH